MSVDVLEKPVPASQAAQARRAVSVDVGYSYTKAVSASGRRACFPSVAAPDGRDALGLAGVFGGGPPEHVVSVRFLDGRAGHYLVGDAARDSLLATGFLGAEKPAELHDLLVLTAAYLVGAGGSGLLPGQAELAVGVPLAFYKAQKAALKARLEGLAAWVSAGDGEERYVSFSRVLVLPQGAGVVFAQRDLPGRGFAAVVDVGQYTTDYLVVDLETGRPVLDACGSVEAGCHLVAQRVSQAYLAKTGRPLPPRMERRVLKDVAETGKAPFRGGEVDLSAEYRAAVKDAADAVARHVLTAWRDFADLVSVTLLAGGGALLLRDALLRAFPNAHLVAEPVFANAVGYLRALSGTNPE
ncbi:MAG: ParM/StbA family protein [Bacillota bacterium]